MLFKVIIVIAFLGVCEAEHAYSSSFVRFNKDHHDNQSEHHGLNEHKKELGLINLEQNVHHPEHNTEHEEKKEHITAHHTPTDHKDEELTPAIHEHKVTHHAFKVEHKPAHHVMKIDPKPEHKEKTLEHISEPHKELKEKHNAGKPGHHESIVGSKLSLSARINGHNNEQDTEKNENEGENLSEQLEKNVQNKTQNIFHNVEHKPEFLGHTNEQTPVHATEHKYEHKIQHIVDHKQLEKRQPKEQILEQQKQHTEKQKGAQQETTHVHLPIKEHIPILPNLEKREEHVQPTKVIPIHDYVQKSTEENQHEQHGHATSYQHISRQDVPAPPPKDFVNHTVKDSLSGDNKSQEETHDDHNVKGAHSLHQTDGSVTVEHTADKQSGFSTTVNHTTKHTEEKHHP